MEAAKYNLTCWQGKTFEKPFYFANGPDKNPTKMNGWTARMQIRPSIDSSTVALELTTENNRIVIDGDRGIVTLVISAADTATLASGSYKYDLELITASGRVYGPLYGSFRVKAEVTR